MRRAADKFAARRIFFYMDLIEKIISELGADEAHAVTICPGRLAYFRGVKAVEELTPEKIILVSGKNTVVCEGENLLVREYFQGDIVIKGNVKKVSVE